MTLESVNRIQDIIRSYNNNPIPYRELYEKCDMEGLLEDLLFLGHNHYIAVMGDGNVFINWSKNKYYPEATIINLKAELKNETREPTFEEKVMIELESLKKRIQALEARI